MTPGHSRQLLAALALLTLVCGDARAQLSRTIDAIRREGCSGAAVSQRAEPLWRNANLGMAAIAIANGRELPDALRSSGYTAANATSFHIRGATGDAAIGRALSVRQYCEQIVDASYTDINWFQRGDETWIVLASTLAPPSLDASAVAARVLELVNAARAEARTCGDERHEATRPVTLSTVLSEVALAHARDMAARQELDSYGADGSTPEERYTRVGYAWKASGENLAAGQRDADAVVAAWLADPTNCARLMGRHYTEMGVAFALDPAGGAASIYWVQTLGAPE
jgi:uncharacterized protein YkwD